MRFRWSISACFAVLFVAFESVHAEPTTGALSFPIGRNGDSAPSAQVTVEKIVPLKKKRSLLHPMAVAAQVAFGIAVRFEQPSAAALAEIPKAMRELGSLHGKSKVLVLKRLALFAPGDPVPRLMAEEATVGAKGQWQFKRTLFSDRKGATDCRLIWGKDGEAMFTFSKGEPVRFSNLLAEKSL